MQKEEIDVQDKVAQCYAEIRYRRHYSRLYHEWWTQKMFSSIRKKEGRILDNGCGIGIFFEFVSLHNNIVGMDISEEMLKKAKKRANKLIRGDSQNLPFIDGSFGVVFNRGLLHHLSDPQKGVNEIYRVLSKKGEAVFVDTNNSFFSSLPRKIAIKGKHFSRDHKNFNKNTLIKIISSKFKIDKIYFFGYIAYPLLGFPDVFDLFKYFPFKNTFAKVLIKIDELLSVIPVVNTQSWCILIKATKEI